ncbi:hypothetical protein [Streptomyces sp. SID3343]|uniref:hypothetical protein n=1 Tax=Streptomyces sp. SID3343 TaxID=2690260 RepID=UPI00136BA498|nr:hypothetical protein [Streptomyces sp. SID3343]MYW02924.1 hypothetical protein [Streptomyces sp. SID3343]
MDNPAVQASGPTRCSRTEVQVFSTGREVLNVGDYVRLLDRDEVAQALRPPGHITSIGSDLDGNPVYWVTPKDRSREVHQWSEFGERLDLLPYEPPDSA